MAKKNTDGKNTSKSKKRPITPGVKGVVKAIQTESTALRKPAAASKNTTSPPTLASNNPQTTFLGLVGANLAGTVLENLATSSNAVKATLSDTLNSALKSQLSATLTSANLPVLSGLVGKMPAADIAAASNLSIQAFLKQQLDPMVSRDPAKQQAVDGEIGRLTTTATVGNLLRLDQPLQAHALFKADAIKARIASQLATSPTLGQDQQLQADFVNRYAASNGSIEDFWLPLSNDPKFKAAIPELKLTLELGMLTPGNPSLLAALRKQYQPASLRDLVKLTPNDWTQLINTNNVPIPSSLSGNTPADKTANYVKEILEPLKSAFASDYISQGLSQRPLDAIDEGVSKFLIRSPDFDFVTTPVTQYLAKSAGVLAGVSEVDQAKIITRIKGYQRLARLNKDFDVMKALMANGLNSAYKIATTPRQAFLQQYAQALGGSSNAEALHATAKGTTASALNLYQSLREGLSKVHPRVFGDVSNEVATAVQQIPNWQELFGSTSACDCQDCKSVLSASAYFADLLHFLSQRHVDPTDKNSPSLLTILSERRPDLTNIKLDCENTNTTLPYVDLVNEILESVIVSRTGQANIIASNGAVRKNNVVTITTAAVHDFTLGQVVAITGVNDSSFDGTFVVTAVPSSTTFTYSETAGDLSSGGGTATAPLPAYNTPADATADDLRVNPEHTNDAAYIPLENAFYPFSLPFDRFLSTARSYLEFAGTSLYEVMKTFQIGVRSAVPANSNAQPTPSDQTIAEEYLNIGTSESLILTGQPFQGTSPLTNLDDLSKYYGYKPSPVASVANNIASNGAVRKSNVVTITTAAAHDFALGQMVTITGVNDDSFDGTSVVTAVPSSTTFTYSEAAGDFSSGGGQVAAAPWYEDLAFVPTFLKRAGIAYEALVSLLETHFLNPLQGITLQENNPDNSCDINSTVINNLVPGDSDHPGPLPRIYRFIRLYTRLGWRISELDTAIIALKAADIDASLLRNLSELKQLQEKWNWSPLETLALWANLDTEGSDSLYVSLFQNKGALKHLDPGLTLRYTAALPITSKLDLSFLDAYAAQISWKAPKFSFEKYLYFTDSNGTPIRMTANQERFLLSLSTDTNYQQAVVQLFLHNPAPLASLPAGFVLPTQLPDAIYHNGNQLCFVGQMSDELWTQLKFAPPSPDVNYQLAVDDLHNMRWTPGTEVAFATQVLASQTGHLIPAQTIPAHANTIAAALRISMTDLSALVTYLWGQSAASPLAVPSDSGGSLGSGTYYVRVSVVDLFGEWLCSNESAAIGANGPTGSIVVSWTQVPGAISYNVYYTKANGGPGNENLKISSAATGAPSVTITTTGLGGSVSSATPPLNPAFPLNLVNLSTVYRHAKLAQALGISAPDLISLIQLIGIKPFQPSTQSTPGTVQFVSKAQEVLQSKFSVAQLDYIYRNISDPTAALGPQQSDLDQFVTSLRSSLGTRPSEKSTASDPTGEFLQQYLGKVLQASDVSEAMGLIAGTFPYLASLNVVPSITFPSLSSGSIAYDQKNSRLIMTGTMSDADEARLLGLSTDSLYQAAIESLYMQPRQFLVNKLFFLDTESLLAKLINDPSATRADKYGFVLNALLDSISLVVQALSSALKLDVALVRLLLVGAQSSSGASVTIVGANFGATQGASTVTFNGTPATPVSWSDTQIAVKMPSGATTGSVMVTVGGTASNGVAFTVDTTPVISAVSPPAGPAVASVMIAGANFGPTQSTSMVTFNGTPATPTWWSDTQIVVTVPSGTTITGIVNVVVTVGGTLSNAVAFIVGTTPVISAVSPPAGLAGAAITIVGANFGATQGASTVTFNGTPATLISWSDTQIVVTMASGATTGNVVVTVGGTASNGVAFTVGTTPVISAVSPPAGLVAAALLASTIDPNLAAIADFFALLGNGLSAFYFSRPGFVGPQPVIIEPTIDFNWGPTSVPSPGLDSKVFSAIWTGFSAKWTGQVVGQFSETYTLYVRIVTSQQDTLSSFANPPLSLWIDGSNLLLTQSPASGSGTGSSISDPVPTGMVKTNGTVVSWVSGQNFDTVWAGATIYIKGMPYTIQSVESSKSLTLASSAVVQSNPVQYYVTGLPVEYTATVDLRAGKLMQIELDYPNAPGSKLTALRLSWSSLSTPKSVIPQHQLYASLAFSFDGLLATYELLWRISLLVNTFRMTLDDVRYLSASSGEFAGVDPNDPAKTAPFDLNTLPINTATYSPAFFNQWERLFALFTLRDSLPGGDAGLLEIFEAAGTTPSVSALVAPIVAATGWNRFEVGLFLGSQNDPLTTETLGFDLSAGDFTDERWLVRLQACLALTTRFGLSSKQLFEWTGLGVSPSGTVTTTNGPTVTWVSGAQFSAAWTLATIYIDGFAYTIQSVSATTLTLSRSAYLQARPVPFYVTGFARSFEQNIARDIQAAIQAHYSATTWIQVGMSLNDKLRESSRDALVAYILANACSWKLTIDTTPVATANELYEYFLIDVQMGSCMQTSRVVQAAAAVQLFVQRCLMNLEQGISPSAIDAATWSWMQNYRVWQAGREVFLFPENYMDPALRDDKTPFFLELETELQQNPLTPGAAEQALVNYLEKLDQVARLDIRAMYWNYDPNSQNLPDGTVDSSNDVLHVFGRTPSSPNIYYYRRLLKASQYGQPNSPAAWTPWEKVNVDIQGDHLVPVVWNGRLYVFWPIFTESSDPTQQPSNSPAPPNKILKIQMAWSRYSQGGWSAKQVSTDSLVPEFYLTSLNAFSSNYSGPLITSLFLFSSDRTSTGDLVIRVWTPMWGNLFYAPGNDIPGERGTPPLPQTDAFFEGDFIFTGCSNDGLISYTDPILNVLQGSEIYLGQYFPLNCEYDANTIDLINSASKLSFLPAFGSQVDILTRTPSRFRIAQPDPAEALSVIENYPEFFAPNKPCVYQDAARCYFVIPKGDYTYVQLAMQFMSFWHPHACAFIKTLNQYGTASLMSLLTQQRTNDGGVVSGFVLSTSSTLTPGLTPGTLYAQGQVYHTPVGTEPSVPQAPSNPAWGFPVLWKLFGNPMGNFYYPNSTHPAIPGDAYIGTVTTLHGQVVAVSTGDGGQPRIFEAVYGPTQAVGAVSPYVWTPYPEEDVDFSFDGAYSAYNWELFFHIPLLIATRFSQDHQFREAQKWFHYVFNPTTNSNDMVPQRFWNFLPFYECSASDQIVGPVEILLAQLENVGELSFRGSLYALSTQVDWVSGQTFDNSWIGATITIHVPWIYGVGSEAPFTVVSVQSSTSLTVSQRFWAGDYQYYVTFTPTLTECGQDVQSQVAAWQAQPFSPFLVGRLRTIAFRKMVVMKYIDNLISWGDFLFAQNTREYINEATQIYILAQQILGDKPVTVPFPGVIPEYSYNDLVRQALADGLSDLDEFSNVLVTLENVFPFSTGTSSWLGNSGTEPVNSVAARSFYFCIPQDDQFLGYWDTVADRLYKIRHCMNLTGQVEQLALFAPPINPALLVQAKAAGMDLNSVLNEINAPVGNYRFTFMLQKALEMCAEVRSLGAALLSSLEKKDAEGLSLLRTTQEINLLQAVLQIKKSQIDEANDNLAGLQASQAVTEYRQQYYQLLITAGLSTFERNQVGSLKDAQSLQAKSQDYEISAATDAMLPNVTLGTGGAMGSPVITATVGGIDIQAQDTAEGRRLGLQASFSSYTANMMGLTGGWDRRAQEWGFQQQLATKELEQIQSQIDAAMIRVQIAQDDLQNQQLQISNSQATLDFMRSKYTSQELYSWMISQVSAIYFQCYQMAYGLAKRAEYCFRFELGLATSSFIQFGYWDSLRKGLLAGESLYPDLKRMELAYLDQNQRGFEITKYISLVLFDPLALITLKETGQCFVSLPEAFFDMDYPGHYMRRLKSVSLTIPCVTGPYTSVNCKLSLISSQIRVDNVASSPQDYAQDSHVITNLAATQSIATSSAQNDSGMFELSFRDERYLPFEGAGVISQWLIELPQDCNVFDFETISDVVINLKYTARDGGDALRAIAKQAAVLPGPAGQSAVTQTAVSFHDQYNLTRFFSLKHEFPTEWYKFINPLSGDNAQTMLLALTKERFPFQYRGKTISIWQVDLLLKFKDIQNALLFTTGSPMGDFVGGADSLNIYLTPSASAPGPQPQPPTWPPASSNEVVLRSTPELFDGTPYGTAGLAPTPPTLLWLQVFTTNDLGSVASTLLDANKHLLPDIIEDIFMVCHYSVV